MRPDYYKRLTEAQKLEWERRLLIDGEVFVSESFGNLTFVDPTQVDLSKLPVTELPNVVVGDSSDSITVP